jgi:hypothetical protein
VTGRRILPATAVVLALAVSTESNAEVRSGSFVGTIQCEALPGQRPLRTAVNMTVADGKAHYEREILQPTGAPSGRFERGGGSVAPSGEITVTARAEAPTYSYDAEYRGQVGESIIRLTGTQRWKIRGETGTIVRPCTLELMRSGQ